MMTFQQWMLNYLATHPAPDLTLGEMALGAFLMGVIVFVVTSFIGEMLVMLVSRSLGRLVVILSLPALVASSLWWPL